MVKIYNDYEDEPIDVFLPLPENLGCEFYSLEMDNYTEDTDFFDPLLPRDGLILEMGCGTGRIAYKLARQQKQATQNRQIIGIDISMDMLRLAYKKQLPVQHNPCFFCMDMVRPAFNFNTQFSAILIAYNTLNLLGSEDKISKCLNACKELLRPNGKLLLQLFTPTKELIRKKKTFQFQIFNRPDGGKIIKEILKKYDHQSRSVHIEERFRVRPIQENQADEDWSKTYTIAGYSERRWLTLFSQAGFTPINIYGDYTGRQHHPLTSSTLIAELIL